MKAKSPLLLTFLFSSLLHAENIIFPDDAGVINVQTAYGAKGDGVTDDTAALNRAYHENKAKSRTLYFPNGRYLISDTVGSTDGKAHGDDRHVTFQGQSEAGVLIQAKDNATAFSDPAKPTPLLSTYKGQGTGDAMRNYVFNMTFDAGKGNPGAVGLHFMSNNTGAIRHVTIRTSDVGRYGLNIGQHQNGPSLIQHVTVEGFDYGIWAGGDNFAHVLEHITLRNQKVMAMYNDKAVTTIRKLLSENSVPVLEIKEWAAVMMFDSMFVGGAADTPAIKTNGKNLYLQDVGQQGYGTFIDAGGKTVTESNLSEWSNRPFLSAFDVDETPLRPEVLETPEIPWEQDFAKWVKVDGSAEDDADAFQAAVDHAAEIGATTLYLDKSQKYKIGKPIHFHGSVERVFLNQCGIDIIPPLHTSTTGEAVFNIGEIDGDAIVFERAWIFPWKRSQNFYLFNNQSGKALVAKNISMETGIFKKASQHGGLFFLEDSASYGIEIGPGEKAYLRQWNPESPSHTFCTVNGGDVWILGLKTEGRYTHAKVVNGTLVVAGGHSYQSWGGQKHDPPMFDLADSTASLTMRMHASGGDKWFTTIVKETQGNESKEIQKQTMWNQNNFMPLYRTKQ
ncbi:MAG: glycosyl hydrolase family 28-related protein [Kiritimatiellia bacterium]